MADGFIKTAQAAGNTANFVLMGGQYGVEGVGTGSMQLNKIGPDGTTTIPVGSSITFPGSSVAILPPGTYFITVTTGPGSVAVDRIKYV